MKKSGSYLTRAVLAVVGSSAALSLLPRAHAQPSTAFIFENFDNNPTGRVFPNISTISTTATFSGGYGLSGRYTSLGTAYNDAFTVVDGGLQFGALASAGGKKLRASGFNSGATATAIMIDGGRAAGDLLYYYDHIYCSYLINFSQISTLSSARAEVRIGGNSTSAFEVHADGPASPASTTLAQPRLGYQLNNFNSAPSPATQGLAANTTYLMLARFDEVGNQLGTSASYTYANNSNSLVLPSNATAFPTGLAVGDLIKGEPGGGIPDNAIVTGLVTSTDGGTTTRTVLINQTTTSQSMDTSVDPPVAAAVTLNSADVVLDRSFTITARTTAGSNTLTNLPSGNALAVGQIVIHSNLPAGTTVTGKPTATTATVSNNATVTASSDITLTVRNISPIRGTYSSSATTMTVDRIPTVIDGVNTVIAIKTGQLVEGPGIADGTTVTAVDTSTRVISLSKETTSPGSGAPVRFYARFATANMWAMTEAQYTNFISAGGTDAVLTAATIGSAANQVTLKISGVQSVGSWEFNQGKRLEIVAHGSSSSPQTFFLDEIRYGFELRSVTRNTPYLTPPPSEPNTAGDDMSKNFYEVNDDGFGWKSGWYEIEETASTPGAFVSSQPGVELTPGSGRYLQIFHRSEIGADQGTRRRPDPAVVDMSQPYTVKFDYKTIDGSGTVNSFSDRIQIGADGPAGAGSNLGPNPGESTNLTWMVGVVGGNDGTNRVFNSDLPEGGTNKTINIGDQPYWHFFDFDPANFIGTSSSPNYYVPKNMQSSGVPFYQLQTDTYSFQIEVNPLTFTYKATVTNRRTGETGSVSNLRFRRQMPAHTLFWGVSKPANETRVVGLDNLRVSQGVPYVDPFPSWVSSFPGVPSGLTGRNVDANGDGRLNFLDFALDGNPMSGTRSAKEIHAISNVGGTNYYTLTIPVRTGATFSATTGPSISTQVDGITYRIQGSYDLANWTTGPDVVPLASPLTTTPALSSGWEYKSFRLSTSTTAQPKAFIRAVVDNAVSP